MYVRVKGFQIFKDRHGKVRCYHRATRTPIDMERLPVGSAEFFAECQRITALATKADVTKPGTLGLLIDKYRSHGAFQDLAPRTKSDYQRVFDYLKPIRDTPIARFDPPLIVQIRDKAGQAKGVKFGNYVKTVLSIIFGWGLERGYAKSNPAFRLKKLKGPKAESEANRPWTDAEREAVLAVLPPRLLGPIAFMMFTGLDPSDTLKLPKRNIREGHLVTRRAKTHTEVIVPLVGRLADILDGLPKHEAESLFISGRQKPWTYPGFQTEWRKVKLALEAAGAVKSGLTLKGLRHTVATILAESGFDERTIADMLGQQTIEMARHYSRRANKSRKLAGVMSEFDAEVSRRREKVVKP